jgi:N-acetylmuramic acid 6-phosphate etherase
MVSAISGCDERTASDTFELSGGCIKTAILLASGAGSLEAAKAMLGESGQMLRPAVKKLQSSQLQ